MNGLPLSMRLKHKIRIKFSDDRKLWFEYNEIMYFIFGRIIGRHLKRQQPMLIYLTQMHVDWSGL